MLTRVGVTGGIASGKSETCQMFRALGAELLSADLIARHLTDHDPTIRKKIVTLIGADAYQGGSGALNRELVGARAFANPQLLRSLNDIVHPAVLDEIDLQLGLLDKNSAARYALIESALLFESGLDERVDYILAVVADEHLRLSRSRLPEEQTRLRMTRQRPTEEVIAGSDFVLFNNESLGQLEKKVAFFHAIFISLTPHAVKNHDKN